MITVPTFTATIWIGSKVRDTGELLSVDLVREWLQNYVNKVGLCVTVTETSFIYTNGGEPGVCVGLINYPRFPSDSLLIRKQAIEIAAGLKERMSQMKVTVVFPDETVMIGDEA